MRVDRAPARPVYFCAEMAVRNSKSADVRRPDRGWLSWFLGSAEWPEGYFAQSRSLALSFVLIAPLLLLYEFALAVYPPAKATGAGRFLRELVTAGFHTRPGMVLNILVVVCLCVAVFLLARRGRLRLGFLVPMVIESVLWAGALFGIAVIICRRANSARVDFAGGLGATVQEIIGSVGAGVYEEILFRLLLTSVLYYAGLKLFGERRLPAGLFAVVFGAVVFAGAHVLARGAVPLDQTGGQLYLAFYLASGVLFSMIYMGRGLGVAVYSHVFYDVAVVFFG